MDTVFRGIKNWKGISLVRLTFSPFFFFPPPSPSFLSIFLLLRFFAPRSPIYRLHLFRGFLMNTATRAVPRPCLLVNGWAWLVYLRVDFHGREKRRGKEKTGTVKREERPVAEWTGGFVIPKENFQDDGGGVVAARSGTINLHSFTWHLYGKAARNQQRNDKSDTEKLLLPSRATPLSGISRLTRDCYRYPCSTEACDAAPSDPGFLSRILHYLPPYSSFNSTL